MRCSNGHDNPTGTRFCGQCGLALDQVCPNCATANSPENRFCGNCGTALGGTAAAGASAPPQQIPGTAPPKAERRIVSVLFADLVAFTPFSESRDPEQVRAMLTTYFDRCREIVARFRGTVDKFIGDAVMAWWGAVGANEDDAERAVRAALELVDMVNNLGSEIGVPALALRAGVLTGEASVGPGGNEQGLIVGDLVNTASRLQSIAPGGSVVVGESTANLVSSSIELEALGEQTLKGKEVPVRAFRAVRVVAQRGGRGRTEGIEPPFVGRHEELRLLKDQLHATGREHRARLISISGDAGIGKSRLAWELLKYLDGIDETVYWHQGRSPAYGDGIAFWAIGEMVRGRAGIVAEVDDRAKARMKLRTAVAEFVPSEDERRWVELRLAALVGLEAMPPGDRSELFAAVRTFFQRISERSTVTMVFEDLHWADDGVLEFITDLVERSTKHPIMVVTLARPDLMQRHPGWGAGRRNHLALHLAPLPDRDMADLIEGVAPGIPKEAVAAIVGRAAGIPLYAVEFVRMLLGSGDLTRTEDGVLIKGDLRKLAVPDTLAAVIGARLDRLDPADRELVQDAAVLGQSFTAHGLAAIRGVDTAAVEAPLRALMRQELLEFDEDPRSPERGQYRFVQGLIREVAYGRLSMSDRHVRHRRVAAYYAGLDDPELAGIVASHYLSAHETAPEGGELLLEEGRGALLGAARRAAALQANSQAMALFLQALQLTTRPADRAPILIEAAEAAGWAGDADESLRLSREAAELMADLGDRDGVIRARTAAAFVLNGSFRADEAVTELEELYSTATEYETATLVRFGLEMARSLMLADRGSEAIELAERILPRAERLLPPPDVIDGIISKATAYSNLGRPLEAEVTLAGAVALADQLDLKRQAIRGLNNLATVQTNTDPRAAGRTADELYGRAIRFGATAWVARASAERVDQLASEGRYDEALATLDGLDFDHLSRLQQEGSRLQRLYIQGQREVVPDIGEQIRAEIDSWQEATDFQARTYIEWWRVNSFAFERDWERISQLAVDIPFPWALQGALLASMRARRPEGCRAALGAIGPVIPATGRLGQALQHLGEGAVLVMEGDRNRGASEMATGLDLISRVGLPLDIADWQTAAATLLGLDHPIGLTAATAAEQWLESVGARGLMRMWAEGLPAQPTAGRAAG